MEKIRSAIIGLGRIASLLEDDSRREKPCTHAGAIASNPDCELSGGFDTSKERRDLFAARWEAPVFSDAAEMLRTVNPGILAIATHPDSHYEYCRLAAAFNIPVIICEKPLADTLSKAKKIAALGKNGSPVIITNHERRYAADYSQAREILRSEKLGEILSVKAVIYMGKTRRLIDVFWHDGTHLADALMFLTDSVLIHRKRWGANLKSTTGTAWLEGEIKPEPPTKQKQAIPAIIEIGAGRDHLVFEIEFSCTKGRLRIGNGVFEIWESTESPYAEKFRSLKMTTGSFDSATGYFANMVADATACFRYRDRKPVSSAADGLRVIKYLNSVKSWR